MDFTDLAGRYLQNRFDQASQPFTDPGAYMENRLGVGGETEEERRKRLEREAAERGNTEVKTQEVKTYADGSQEHIVKTQQPAPMPVAPVAPVAPPVAMQEPTLPPALTTPPSTVTQPVTPVPPPAAPPVAAPPAGPAGAPPVWSDIRGQEVNNGAPTMPALAQNQGPVNPAVATPAVNYPPVLSPAVPVAPTTTAPAPTVNAAPTAPVSPTAPTAPAAGPQPLPTPVEQIGPPTSAMSGPGWQERLSDARTTGDYQTIMVDPNTPDDIRKYAATRYADSLKGLKQEKEALTTVVNAAQGDPKAQNDLARALRKNTEEGSYIKAILFARFGLNDLAKEEQQKLGAGTMFQSLVSGNERYTAEVNGQGAVVQAFDTSGRAVDEKTLAQLNAQGALGKGAVTGQTFGKDANGDVISHTILPGGRGVLWKNETTGASLSNAPAGYHSMGQKSLEQIAAEKSVGTAAQIETKMRKANTDAQLMGLPVPYSEAAISAEKNRVGTSAGGVVRGNVPQFSSPSIQIISAQRTPQQQDALKDHRDAQGNWVTKEGNPVSDTSLHLTGNALDIDNNKLDAIGRKELISKGYYQPIPQRDPNHWEKIEPTSVTAADNPAAPTAPTIAGRPSSIAEKIANYEMKPPASRSASYGPLMQEVARLNPEYDETKYSTVQDARKKFTTGKQGDTVRSMNVAIDHLDTLADAGRALNNGDLRLFNEIANDYQKNVGGPAITDFNGVKSIVGSEVAKAVAGGQMALADREEIRKELDAANSPQQLNGVIKRFQQLLGGQLKGLKTQYEEAGLRDFDKKLTPRTKRVLGEGGGEHKQSRSNW